MVKKAITVKLVKSDIEVLKKLGGNTKGIETLIADYTENKSLSCKDNPEDAFFNSIYLPVDKNMKATYIAYLNMYLKKRIRAEGIGYSLPSIMGATGFDDQTIRKHFKKLVTVGFVIPVDGAMFRPTLRLFDTVSPEDFSKTLEEYSAFIRGTDDYTDFLGE